MGHSVRTASLILASGVLVACGVGDPAARDTMPTTPSTSTTGDVPVVASTTPDTTTPDTTTTDTTTPDTTTTGSTTPDSAEPGRAPGPGPLSVSDALLPPDSFPPPWEHQHTQTDPISYDVGPNQSDCEPFWRYNSIQGRHDAQTLWWINGGNANHWVTRMPQPEAVALVAEIATVPDACPIVSWSEGDFFTVRRLDLGNDDIVGFEMVTQPGRDRDWVATTTHGDLVSTLWVPLWPSFDDDEFIDMSVADFAAIAAEMRARLLQAGTAAPDEVSPPTTQLTTQPDPSPDPSVEPPAEPPAEPVPSQPRPLPDVTLPPIVEPDVTVPDDPTGTAELLLTPDDLASTGIGTEWEFDEIEPYEPSPGVSSAESCPALASSDRIDEVLTWRSVIDSDDSFEVRQLLGPTGSVEQAAKLVTDFARIADCDLSDLLDGAEITFPPVKVDGARAVYAEVGVPGENDREGTLVMAVDRYVTVLTIQVPTDRLETYDEFLHEVAERAARRLRR